MSFQICFFLIIILYKNTAYVYEISFVSLAEIFQNIFQGQVVQAREVWF